jgi:hypothetical protein
LSRARLGWLFASAILGVLLLALLFVSTDLDLAALGRLLLRVRLHQLAEIVLLLGLNNALAGEKWRLIAMRLGAGDAAAMPRPLYFAFTSVGVALGQIVPAQLSLLLSRSIGAHLHGGSALSRGVTATLFDYFFDVVVAAFFAAASILVLLVGGGEWLWGLSALAICLAGFSLYGVGARLIAVLARVASGFGSRIEAVSGALALTSLLTPDIGRRLLAISLLRYAVLVAMGAVSAAAVDLDLPFWHIAAALPFAVVANALALTPGSLGVNEWTVSSALFALGTPLSVSAAWALVNRVLVAVAAVFWGVAGVLIAAAARPPRRHG